MQLGYFCHIIKPLRVLLSVFFVLFFCQLNGQKKIKLSRSNSPVVHDTMTVDDGKKNFRFTPFAAPSYTPEQGLMVKAGGLMSFKIQPDNQFLERSSIPFSVGYSTNGSATAYIMPYIYGKDNKYKIETKLYYTDMPDNYWGVGYDAANRTSSPDSTTSYNRQWWSFEGQVVFKVKSGFNLGLVYDITATEASNLNSTMEQDESVQEYGTHVRNLGLGIALELDYRDNAQNPYSGYLVNLAFLNYNGLIASNGNDFNKVKLDVRKYFAVGDRKTVALQFNTEHTGGDVPWTEMPQVGTPTDLRGYQWGRFRDKTATFGIAEYRHMITRRTVNKKGSFDSRLGFVGWVGAGCVSSNYATMHNWIPNVGVGIRAEIQPRMNLRIDYGIGKDSKAFYVAFSEAF